MKSKWMKITFRKGRGSIMYAPYYVWENVIGKVGTFERVIIQCIISANSELFRFPIHCFIVLNLNIVSDIINSTYDSYKRRKQISEKPASMMMSSEIILKRA